MRQERYRYYLDIKSFSLLTLRFLWSFTLAILIPLNAYAYPIIAGTFSGVTDLTDFSLPATDAIYLLNSDGSVNRQIASGLSGLEFITPSPGGDFGSRNEYYAASIGGHKNADGAVHRFDLNGGFSPFLTGIDAVSVVFDTDNVLGGGMFISDFNTKEEPGTNPGKIWRVTPSSSPLAPPVGAPILADPNNFQIELYADFAQLSGATRAFFMGMSDGSNGFDPGLYVTSAFSSSPGRIVRVFGPNQAEIFRDGLNDPTSFVFSEGAYGSGMLIAEPLDLLIERLMPDGSLFDFATLGTMPIGPEGLSFYPDGHLYVTDFTSGDILRVLPNGTIDSTFSASIPLASVSGVFTGAKSHLSAVPEPATILLIGIGVVVIATLNRRKRHIGIRTVVKLAAA